MNEKATEIHPEDQVRLAEPAPTGLVRVAPPKAKGLMMQPQSTGEAMEMATMLSKSELVPASYRNKPADTLVAMMMGNELGLNPIQALSNISVINGRAAVWGDAMLALVQNHPAFGYIEESFDDATMTATCTVCRKGGRPHTQTFSRADAVSAGLWDDRRKVTRKRNGQNVEVWNDSPWHRYPKRMLAMRARGFALRGQFADALLGLITAEEAYDYPEEVPAGVVVSTQGEPQQLPEMPDEKFATTKAEFEPLIIAGKRTPAELIAKLSTKYHLSAQQVQVINNMETTDDENA